MQSLKRLLVTAAFLSAVGAGFTGVLAVALSLSAG